MVRELAKDLARVATALEQSADSLADIRALMVRRQRYFEIEWTEEAIAHMNHMQTEAGEKIVNLEIERPLPRIT